MEEATKHIKQFFEEWFTPSYEGKLTSKSLLLAVFAAGYARGFSAGTHFTEDSIDRLKLKITVQ